VTSAKICRFPNIELGITAIYLVVASAWIIFSDRWLEHWSGHTHQSVSMQTLKGLNFVLITALLLYIVLRRAHTRRRAAEACLRELADRFELVARASNDAIWDWNLLTNFIWWSDGYTQLFGWGEKDTEPTIECWVKNLHPDDRERVVAKIHALIDSGGSYWSDEYRYRRKDGTYAHVYDRGFVVHETPGKPVRMLGGIMDISEQKQIEERLRDTEGQLRALTARLQSISESERQRIAREIHDELGQLLTGIKFDLSWIENRIEKLDNAPAVNPILDRVVEANELADDSIKAVQRIASDLRPGVLDSLGLISALKYEAGRFRERTGITFELRVNDESAPVPINVSVAAFRIFQEALTNVARHANATRIEIDLNVNEDHLDLDICDNGRGIDAKSLNNRTSIGLLGMKERAMAHGGEVRIEPRRIGGTRVQVRLPFAADAIESHARIDPCVSLL